MSDFNVFKLAVARQFSRMAQHGVFRTSTDKEELWNVYLSSFPEGSNPVFKERTEHDCNCCKQFIRAVGNAVAIIDGKLESIWDISIDVGVYQTVANALAAKIRLDGIESPFFHFERTAGTDKNNSLFGGVVSTYEHFFVNIPPKFVMNGRDIPSKLGELTSLRDVLKRSLEEITSDSLDTVLELIAQNTLYRGEEHKFAVTSFKDLKNQYSKLKTVIDKDMFVWNQISKNIPASVSKIRNTSIGTLLTDISEDKELEYAVKSYESKVAPSNYKRPTALITKSMIDNAQKKIQELGLGSALERRYAKLSDITINNILHANRETRKQMLDIFDELKDKTSDKIPIMKNLEDISIDKFISDVLPKAESIELLFEGKHSGNLVSLVAPVDPTAKHLFKWDNNFSWSYSGEVTDSIKERVKAAGGNVTGDLCCRLAWDYTDDLDLFIVEPDGRKIYYGNRRSKSNNGGQLDVDANGMDGIRENPVENIFYTDKSKMQEGNYTLSVNNYNRRSSGSGFDIQIEALGETFNMSSSLTLATGKTVEVAVINYSKSKGFTVTSKLDMKASSKPIWNIPTNSFHKVNVLMLSPNHWDNKPIGNKHFFFMLDGCINDDSTRGFYNEFLSNELDIHRKVFEVVGSKMKTEKSDGQLSGLGFSSTQRNSVVCRVKGSFTRLLKINF